MGNGAGATGNLSQFPTTMLIDRMGTNGSFIATLNADCATHSNSIPDPLCPDYCVEFIWSDTSTSSLAKWEIETAVDHHWFSIFAFPEIQNSVRRNSSVCEICPIIVGSLFSCLIRVNYGQWERNGSLLRWIAMHRSRLVLLEKTTLGSLNIGVNKVETINARDAVFVAVGGNRDSL